MKLISYKQNGSIKFGAFEEGMIYDLHALDANIADNMLEFLQGGEEQLQLAISAVVSGNPTLSAKDVELNSPVPNPPSVRDAYAFRQHVATARRNRGLELMKSPYFILPITMRYSEREISPYYHAILRNWTLN